MIFTALFPLIVLNLAPDTFFGELFVLQMKNSVSSQNPHAPSCFYLLLCFTYFFYKYQWVQNLMISTLLLAYQNMLPLYLFIAVSKYQWLFLALSTSLLSLIISLLYRSYSIPIPLDFLFVLLWNLLDSTPSSIFRIRRPERHTEFKMWQNNILVWWQMVFFYLFILFPLHKILFGFRH